MGEKEFFGRVAAQKKELIDSINAILGSASEEIPINDVSGFTSEKQAAAAAQGNQISWKLIREHESRFAATISKAVENVSVAVTRDVLKNHLDASPLAVDAMSEFETVNPPLK